MITLSNEHSFQYMTASGAMGYDGRGWPWEKPLVWTGVIDPRLFTHVTKTLTRRPLVGNLRWWNPAGCVRLIKGGTVNAVGLTNPGIEWWVRQVAPRVERSGLDIIVSIKSESPRELRGMVTMLNDVPIKGIELNISCPNTRDELMSNCALAQECVEAAVDESRHPVGVKLSVAHAIAQLVPRLIGVEWFSINSVPWSTVFPHRRSPLQKLGGGGVSGKVAQEYTWTLLRMLVRMTPIPVCGASIWNYRDLDTLLRFGAAALSFGAVHIPYPGRPTRFVRKHKREAVAVQATADLE